MAIDNFIYLEVDGVQYSGFTGATVSLSMTTMCNTFSFTTTSVINNNFPIKVGQTCRIIINGETVLTGFIEGIAVDYDSSSNNITISGRDRTCDLVDSTIGQNIDFGSGILLEDVARKILKLLNMNDVKVINKYELDAFQKSEIVKSQVGQTGFNFLELYAQKRQVLTTTNGDGNIEFLRTSETPLKTILNSTKNISNAIILSANLTLDYTDRFHQYVLNCQFNPSSDDSDDFDLTPDSETHVAANYFDPAIRNTRLYNFISDSSYDKSMATERAKWESNVRISKSFIYNCVVQGFSAINDGFIWRPNQFVTVIDDLCNINSKLLISDVSYEQTLNGGSKTTLKLVDRDSFSIATLDAETFKKKRKTRNEANNLVI